MDDNESRVIRVAISHRKCKNGHCNESDCREVSRVLDKLGSSFEKDKVKIEYVDFEFHQLGIPSEKEIEEYVLTKADIAVVLVEGKFGQEQEEGYKKIIGRYNKNKEETDPGKKLHAPKLCPYVLVREKYKEDDLALLEEVRKYGLYAEDFHSTAELRGLLLDRLEDEIKQILSRAESIGSNQQEGETKGEEQIQGPSAPEVSKTVTEAASKPQPLPQPDGVSKGAEPNPLPDQPGTVASTQGEGHKKPGRWKVVAGIVASAAILALLFVLLAPYYRPFVNSLWNGSTPNTDSLQTGAGAIVPVDTVKTPVPTDEPKKQDPLPKYIENGCTVKSKDGDISLVNAIKGEILNCEALNLAFPEKGRTAWKIEIWEAKKQLDSTASGNNIAHFQYSASIHYKGNQVAGAESDWDNSYSRSRLSGDKALTEAREKARAEIINTIIEKLKR